MVLAALPPTLFAAGNLALFALVLLLAVERLSDKPGTVALLTGTGALLTAGYGAISAGGLAFPITGTAAVVLLGSLLLPRVRPQLPEQQVELGAAFLLAGAGAVALSTSSHLVSMIVGLETLSLAIAVSTALSKGPGAVEAAFKYFMVSCVAIAAAVYGMGLHALTTGSLELSAVPLRDPWAQPLHTAAIVLLTVGFAFELAVVPFHFALLGPYATATPVVAGFAMALAKLGAVVGLGRIAQSLPLVTGPVLTVVGVTSILWGTIGALGQRGMRGMLAYSAIAHGGFLALALGSGASGQQAAVFYVVIYAATTLLTFAAIADREDALPMGEGLGAKLGRGRALALAFGLLSLAGVPPTPGFFAKLAVLGPAFAEAGWLAATLATAGAVAGALFYLRPVPDLLAADGGERVPATTRVAMLGAGITIAVFTVAPWLAFRLL